MKVVITGAAGRLGAALCELYSQRHEVIALDRKGLDLALPQHCREVLDGVEFDALVNCAALTNVDYCETHEAESLRINAESVGEIAALCTERGARMVHISTDYVFDGEKQGAYTEEDAAEPISVYGLSKLRGEQALLAVSERHLAVRVSWVFGPHRPSFIDMLLKRALTEPEAAAIGDKFSTPAFTLDLAAWLEPLFDGRCSAGGVLHLCNSGATTWQEYGQKALDLALSKGVPLKANKVASLRLADMKNFVARRPVNSVMSVDKFATLTGITPRPWQEAVESYLFDHGGLSALSV